MILFDDATFDQIPLDELREYHRTIERRTLDVDEREADLARIDARIAELEAQERLSSADLPWAALQLVDDPVGRRQSVEVLVDGKTVAKLPACSFGYEGTVHGTGVLTVGVHVGHTVTIAGGDLMAIEGTVDR